MPSRPLNPPMNDHCCGERLDDDGRAQRNDGKIGARQTASVEKEAAQHIGRNRWHHQRQEQPHERAVAEKWQLP